MDVDQLITFLTIAKNKTFSHAAKTLHLSQPSISKRIKTLESELNCTLFIRIGRDVKLSAEGETFVPYAEKALAALNEGKMVISNLNSSSNQSLIRIGCTRILSYYIVPQLVQEYRKKFPDRQIVIQTNRSQRIVEMLQNKEIDIAVISTSHPLHGIYTVPFIQDRYTFVINHDHPLARKSTIKLQDLVNYPIIRYGNAHKFWRPIESLLKENHVEPKNLLETNSAEVIKRLVAKEMGISFLPYYAISEELRNKQLVTLQIEGITLPEINVVIACNSLIHNKPFIRNFIKIGEKIKKEV